MIYYIGLGINLFLLLILVTKKGKNLADNILAIWLFAIAVHTILYVINLQPANIDNIHWIMSVGSCFPLLHGPFLYLYTAASTNLLPSNKKKWWLHFLPALITVIYLMPIYLLSAEEKMEIYLNKGKGYETANTILLSTIHLSGLVYVIWSFILLRKHKKNIGEQFSYEERINLNWLRYLIYGLLVIWIIIIVFKKNSIIFGAGVVFVTLLGFLGIRQVGIFGKKQVFLAGDIEPKTPPFAKKEIAEPAPEEETATNLQKKKYANSGLTPEMAEDLHNRLKQVMAEEKSYTEPELSLVTLAARLNVHSNYLSQVINERENKNFFDYINTLRVEEFKKLISLPANSQFTIMSIAYECGFNSKSSFNKNFKKVTGQSPSEYMSQLSNQKG
ncbi:AraC family transcriptional regulator [Sediminibacterium sp.]|uniref:helix-turn-helix domain-containing protein n=1 Tax=Sediminibacterium sp. TaxID=1917865 RepID=UPI0025D6B352|nr:AraC family transcriptional regulator [Sediminibacterium sp.]MBW0178394.1 AraC family transcriptional regulator [Sediminibacterium sp.]